MTPLLILKIFAAWIFFVIATINLLSEARKHAKFIIRYSPNAHWPISGAIKKLFYISIFYSIWYMFLFA